MSNTSRFAVAVAACLLTGTTVEAQTAGPTAGVNATGMDGKALNGSALNGAGTPGAGLGGAGTGGTGPGEPGKASAAGVGTGTASGTTKPAGASVGLQPAPGMNTKAAP